MGQTQGKIFEKRFGDRIAVVFSDRLYQPAEQKVQSEALCKAVKQVMAGILKREPTPEEVLGLDDISKRKRRR